MKLQRTGTALVLALTLPTALSEAGLRAPLAPACAHAQADAITEVARQRYEDGVRAFDAGRFEDARTAFLQAYALKRHPAVLLNLGQSELRAGHVEDAGNHLQQFLREHASATPEQRAAAERGIADAKKRTAFIIPIVDAQGAELSIDGSAVGTAPLLDPVFVKPGKRTVFATFQGRSATAQVDARAGTATPATLNVGGNVAVVPAPAPAPAGPAPAPSPGPVASGGPGAAAPFEPTPGPLAESSPSSFLTFGASSGADAVPSSREPFLEWYTRKPVAWIGTGVAAVGLGLGLGFSLAASGSSSESEEIVAQIRTFERDNPQTNPDGRAPCGARDARGGDLPGYERACDALRDTFAAHDRNVALATTGWVLLGVGVIGTATYAVIDWYAKPSSTGRAAPVRFALTPLVSPTERGLGVVGSF